MILGESMSREELFQLLDRVFSGQSTPEEEMINNLNLKGDTNECSKQGSETEGRGSETKVGGSSQG